MNNTQEQMVKDNILELERLNGFPDDWSKYDSNGKQVSDAKRAFFMGNALVIGLIEIVGKVISFDLKISSFASSKLHLGRIG
mgnify:CR=1 FL=1